jgi:sigma-E factor negative regulatory protein RseC
VENAGQVTRTLGERAEVLVKASAACGNCEAAAMCGAGGKSRSLLARNPIGAAAGDWVVISVSESRGTLSALVAFGIPALLLLAGVLAGGLTRGDLWAGILGGAGLAVGVLVVTIVDRRTRQSGRGLPEIVRKIESPEAFDCKGGGSEAVSDDGTSARDGDEPGPGR